MQYEMFPVRRVPIFTHNRVSIYDATRGCDIELAETLRNMRERDLHEYYAVGSDPDVDAWGMIKASPRAFIALKDTEPVFAFGYINSYPHVALVWGFGTDDANKAIPAITKYGREVFLPELFKGGITRLEVRVPSSCAKSAAWLMYNFGARCECSNLEGLSVTGEPMWQLALTPELFQRKINVQGKQAAFCASA